MINKAAEAGADLVKFQTFTAETLVTYSAEKAQYQQNLTDEGESQFEMIKKLELDQAAHQELIEHCEKKDICFLSTAFDHSSIDLLAELNIPFYKVPSGEITNLPYLRHVGRMRKPVVMSTGMATLEEVRDALNVLLKAGSKKDQITILQVKHTMLERINLLSQANERRYAAWSLFSGRDRFTSTGV